MSCHDTRFCRLHRVEMHVGGFNTFVKSNTAKRGEEKCKPNVSKCKFLERYVHVENHDNLQGGELLKTKQIFQLYLFNPLQSTHLEM